MLQKAKGVPLLERAGLICRGRSAQWRPCRLRTKRIKEVADWLEMYRREQSFDRLDTYLEQLPEVTMPAAEQIEQQT